MQRLTDYQLANIQESWRDYESSLYNYNSKVLTYNRMRDNMNRVYSVSKDEAIREKLDAMIYPEPPTEPMFPKELVEQELRRRKLLEEEKKI